MGTLNKFTLNGDLGTFQRVVLPSTSDAKVLSLKLSIWHLSPCVDARTGYIIYLIRRANRIGSILAYSDQYEIENLSF